MSREANHRAQAAVIAQRGINVKAYGGFTTPEDSPEPKYSFGLFTLLTGCVTILAEEGVIDVENFVDEASNGNSNEGECPTEGGDGDTGESDGGEESDPNGGGGEGGD